MRLNQENIEEQILLLVDGELDDTTAAGVIAYVEQHKEYKALLDLYLATQLQPDVTITFPGKESLLKAEQKIAPIKRLSYRNLRWAAAAAIVITIITTAVVWRQEPEPTDQPATAMQQPIPQQRNTISARDILRDSSIAKASSDAPQKEKNKRSLHQQVIAKTVPAAVPVLSEARKKEEVVSLVTAGKTEMAIAAKPVAVALEESIAIVQPKAAHSSWSPLKEETLDGVDELVAEIQAIKTDVKEKAQLLKKATLVLRLGDKEIALNK